MPDGSARFPPPQRAALDGSAFDANMQAMTDISPDSKNGRLPAARPAGPGLIALALSLGVLAAALSASRPVRAQETRPVTVAFIGDQGSGAGARAVLWMIRAQQADMVLHQGDFDYDDDPAAWDRMISGILGPDFPYFASVGNHDRRGWGGPGGYQAKLKARLARIAGARCEGDLGVMSACTYRGLFFILSGIGTLPDDRPDAPRQVAFIRDRLAHARSRWRICNWHKNQAAMQAGRKDDAVGWLAYDACRRGGAIIATGHEHSYSRTYLMAGFRDRRIASTSATMVVTRGRSFAFVSGLGGKSIRPQRRHDAWWASVYTRDQDADYGALFCTFNAGGDPTRARCRFQDIRGRVPDRFEIVSGIDGVTAPVQAGRKPAIR